MITLFGGIVGREISKSNFRIGRLKLGRASFVIRVEIAPH